MNVISRLTIFALLFGAIITSCNQPTNMVIITGEVINNNTDSVFITDNENTTIAKAVLDAEGKFEINLSTEKEQLLNFFDGKESSKIYVVPGKDFHISLDAKEFDESLKYTGDGAVNNNFLASYYLQFEDGDNKELPNLYEESTKLSPADYLLLAKEDFTKKNKAIDEANSDGNLNSNLIKNKKNTILLTYANNLAYPSYQIKMGEEPKDNSAYDELRQEIFSVKDRIKNPDKTNLYKYYIMGTYPTALTHKVYAEHIGDKSDINDSLIFSKLVEAYNDEEINIYLFETINRSLESYRIQAYDDKKDIIEEFLTDAKLKAELLENYEKLKITLEAGYAPGLKMMDYALEENEAKDFNTILENHKGKVIYMDIWASWCGPCKAEMPFSKKLKEKFHGKDVDFVYISTDRNTDDWTKILKIMQLEGNHYHADKDIHKYLGSEFNLQYIPHFIVFDKEGKLIKNNAPRPSSEEVVTLLNSLL